MDLVNPRRAPRLTHRCRVDVRDRFAAWTAATEDLGPLGCQLITPRLAAPGRELRLRIYCEAIGQTIETSGTVVWSRAESPSRLGVRFPAERVRPPWFDLLRLAAPEATTTRFLPDRLPHDTVLRLGEPPRFMADFSAEEVAVLRRIGAGITIEGLARQLGSAFERVRGSIFSLLARRLLVLSAAESVTPPRWSEPLASAEKALAAAGVKLPAPTVGPHGAIGRSAAAQALFDEGIAHLTAGRIEVAVSRLREARRLAPTDPLIAGALQRLAPWASQEADPAGGAATATVGARGKGRIPR
jgi:PilZ domain